MIRDLKGIYIIWLRDIKKFFRDKPRLLSSIARPSLYLFILGSGLSSAFGMFAGGRDWYMDFVYPGILGMVIIFTSLHSAFSIVWDREFGFLKEILVSPISRTSIAIGKALSGSTISLLQGIILLLFAPLLHIKLNFPMIIKICLLILLSSFALTSFGISIAARMKSMQGFNMVMNFLTMPMFFLSGAMFPLKELPKWLEYLVNINPLSYSIDALRYVMLEDKMFLAHPFFINILVMSIFAVIMISASIFAFNLSD
jgi:ABC-2 type transport system permease protein